MRAFCVLKCVLVHSLIVMDNLDITNVFFSACADHYQLRKYSHKISYRSLLHNEFAYSQFFNGYWVEPRSKNHLKCNILIKNLILSRSPRNYYKQKK